MSSRAVTYVVGTLVVLAAIGGWYAWHATYGKLGGTPNDSPVHVAGGSILLKADSGWTPSDQSGKQFTSNDCVDVTILEFGGVVADGYSKKPSVTNTWQIRALVSNPDGSAPYVGVLVSPDGSSCQTGQANFQHVVITPIDKKDDSLNPNNGSATEKIYSRNGCQNHQSSCEALASAELQGMHTYTCMQSNGCMVWIGQRK